MASPLTIIERSEIDNDIEAIVNVVNQNQVGQIIIGLPRAMNGSVSKQAEKVQAFATVLCHYTEVPVDFRDERLTTVQAKRSIQASSPKKTKGRHSDDDVAAALILQGYLDEEREGNSTDN